MIKKIIILTLILLEVLSTNCLADRAELTIINGEITGTINGYSIHPTPLTLSFTTNYYNYYHYSIIDSNQRLWISGSIDPSLWCDWNCYIGKFGGHTYPTQLVELYPNNVNNVFINYTNRFNQIINYNLVNLVGERVIVNRISNGYSLIIGIPLFEFLEYYFAGDLRADITRDGIINVQDVFDYIIDYLDD